MTKSFLSAQDFIARVRMAADPVDMLIAPRVAQIGLLDFHRGAEAIAAGRRAVEAQAEQLVDLRKIFPAGPDLAQYLSPPRGSVFQSRTRSQERTIAPKAFLWFERPWH